jgi:hypothetical protein
MLLNTASDLLLGDQAEEPFDLVEPQGRGRREVHMEVAMPLELGMDLRLLVGGWGNCRRSDGCRDASASRVGPGGRSDSAKAPAVGTTVSLARLGRHFRYFNPRELRQRPGRDPE